MEHALEKLEYCPICSAKEFETKLSLNDYFLSQESFTIVQCKSCGFQFTNPRPTEKASSAYYQTENYLSHSTSKKTLFSFVYQTVKNINLGLKYRLIRNYIQPGRMLDIGCGTGSLIHYFQKRGWQVSGMEPNITAAELAKKEFGLSVYNSLNHPELEKQKFDLITLWHVLEHIHSLEDYLKQIKKLLNQNGVLVLALPNPNSYDAKYYDKYWAGYDVPRHLYHFSKSDIKALATKHNFKVEKMAPMIFDSFYVSLLSEKYLKNRFGFFRAIWIGLRSNLKSSTKNPNTSSLIYILKPN